MVVCGVHIGAGADQYSHQALVIAMRRPVQGGRAIAVAGVDVDAIRDQCPDRVTIGRPRRGDQLEAGGPRLGAGGRDPHPYQETGRQHTRERFAQAPHHDPYPHFVNGRRRPYRPKMMSAAKMNASLCDVETALSSPMAPVAGGVP